MLWAALLRIVLCVIGTCSAGASTSWRHRYCDATVGDVCIVTSNRHISRSFVFRHSGSIHFKGARWTCVPRPSAFESVRIDISVTGKILLRNGSRLHCATVVLEAAQVEISDSSEVTANGTSYEGLGMEAASRLWSSDALEGSAHGGLGGSADGCGNDDSQLVKRLGQVYGDPMAPWRFGRAAGSAVGRGLGGGRVRILARDVLQLNGTVSACGKGPEETDPELLAGAAAGSGGSIWITARAIREPGVVPTATITTLGSGAVDFVDELEGKEAGSKFGGGIMAIGGSCARCLCGGGGRVLIEASEGSAPRHVVVAGGCWRDASKNLGDECRCGSAGTWVWRKAGGDKRRRAISTAFQSGPSPWLPWWRPRWLRDQRLNHIQPALLSSDSQIVVHVDNTYAVTLAGTKLELPTPLGRFDIPVVLTLHDAVVVPDNEEPSWTLSGLQLLSDQSGSTLRHLHAKPFILNFTQPNQGVELAFSSTLQAAELEIVGAQSIVLRQNAAVDATVARMMATRLIDVHQGSLGQGAGSFHLYAPKVVLGGGRLRMANIHAEEELRLKSGHRLRASHRRCDQLPAPSNKDPCEEALLPYSLGRSDKTNLANVTFDVILSAHNGSIVIEDGAELSAAAVLLCAVGNTSIAGLISARGLGCSPNRGESAGATPAASESTELAKSRLAASQFSMCGGGGGAHAGNGGDGVRDRSRTQCAGTGGAKYDGWWSSETAGTAKPSRLPTWSASGGGGKSAGAGGGIVWVCSAGLDLPSNGTSISASGDDASQWADGITEGAGGGAGGSVIINASRIRGTGAVEAAGGRGGGCIGGGGGGGAVGSCGSKPVEAWAEFQGRLTVAGGSGDGSPGCGKHVGSSGSEGELLQLGVCQPGQAGIFCAQCPPGTYNPPHDAHNLTAAFRVCLPCKNKPESGNYTASGWLNESCPYACPGGFPPVEVNPNCDDPWTYYFGFFGGVWGVASFILVIAFLFGFSMSATHVRKLRRLQWLRRQRSCGAQFYGMDDEVLFLFESVRGRHPLAELGFLQRGLGGVRPTARFPRLHFLRRFLQRLRSPLTRTEATVLPPEGHGLLLRTGDLPYHAARIYLLGENSPHDPWRLCGRPPQELSHLIDSKRWETFSTKVNDFCSEGMVLQGLAEGVLRWLYLPLAEHLRWRLRLRRAADVAAFVWSTSEASRPDQTIWRLIRDSSSRFSLRFGTDWQMTLAFIDVLDYGRSLQDWVVKPQLPLVIAAAGDGEYTAPYHLEYTDPFVQSVAQYVGRRTWHQVLLAFNQVARLLPPSPTEEDIQPLRRSMARISVHVLGQTDLECHAVLFQAPAAPAHRPVRAGRAERFNSASNSSLQTSWATEFVQPGAQRAISLCVSPLGCQTPVSGGGAEAVQEWRHRLALVLTQRVVAEQPMGNGSSISVAPNRRTYVGRVLRVGSSGLTSLAEGLPGLQTTNSPALGFKPDPAGDPSIDEIYLLGSSSYVTKNPFADAFASGLHSRHGSSGSLASGPPSPGDTIEGGRGIGGVGGSSGSGFRGAPGRFWGSPPPSRTRRRWSPRRMSVRSFWRDFRAWISSRRQNFRGFLKLSSHRLEDVIHFAAAPGNAMYHIYVKKLRGSGALGGVGRQPGLYLRHRKPRGSRTITLLCLILSLLVGVFCFIAESAVLFRLGPRHGAFFLALLWPPFADILALVLGVLFVCGAADGTLVCLYMVASNWNTAMGLISRLLTMDTLRSVGVLHVLAEYAIAFSVKVAVCRLVNLMISYAEAEPILLEPSGYDTDPDWVREYVLFNSPARDGPRRSSSDLPGTTVQDLAKERMRRTTSLEELADLTEDANNYWFLRRPDSSFNNANGSNFMAAADSELVTEDHAGGSSPEPEEFLGQLSSGTDRASQGGSDFWTPLPREGRPGSSAAAGGENPVFGRQRTL